MTGMFFNHKGVTHELTIEETEWIGIFSAEVDRKYETYFSAPDDCALVDLMCFAVEAFKEEYPHV